MRTAARALVIVVSTCLVPAIVSAQAVITGVVRDTSGAVLPGVTVEASSPALIEKVRVGVDRRERAVSHRGPPSRHLLGDIHAPGFSTFKREGIELTGSFTATINAELRVGHLEETITVTGETPVVDIQSARREMTLNNDVFKPSRRSAATTPWCRGARRRHELERRRDRDGDDAVSHPRRPQQRGPHDDCGTEHRQSRRREPAAWYIADIGNAQEVTFTTSGGLGESETAGLMMNVVPKTGGNTMSGAVFFSGTGEKLQSDNYTDEFEAAGLAAPIPLAKVYDLNGAVGGPIMKDRVWYFANARTQGSTRRIATSTTT